MTAGVDTASLRVSTVRAWTALLVGAVIWELVHRRNRPLWDRLVFDLTSPGRISTGVKS